MNDSPRCAVYVRLQAVGVCFTSVGSRRMLEAWPLHNRRYAQIKSERVALNPKPLNL